MPTRMKRVNASDRKVIDEDGLHDLLLGLKIIGVRRFIMERVGGLPGQSAPRAFTFGYGFGFLLSTARMLHFETELVTPQIWKSAMIKSRRGTATSPKLPAMNAATKAFGNEHWKRKMDHGRAEAALIALYGAQHIWGVKG